MLTEINADMLTSMVQSVFLTMMDVEVSGSSETWAPSADRLIASIYWTGDWNGVLQFECSRQQACQFAGRFLSIAAPGDVDDDVRDVLGELTNMIGGNLKCALTSGLSLSMPSVTDGTNYGLRVCGAELQGRVALKCGDDSFWVALFAMNSEKIAVARQH